MRNYASILPGARVRSDDGFIGTVERLDARATDAADKPDRMVVRSEDQQWRYSIPLMFVNRVMQGRFHPIVHVAVHTDELTHYILGPVDPRASSEKAQPSGKGYDIADQPTTVLNADSLRPGQPMPHDDTVLRMPVHEEELIVRKKPVVLGKVRVHKGVEMVEQEVGVDVYHEEAIIEHIPPEEYDGLAPQNPNEVIIPIIEERLVVQKQSVIKEYIRVRKKLVAQHKDVRGMVRREVVQISEERQTKAAPDAPPLLYQLDSKTDTTTPS